MQIEIKVTHTLAPEVLKLVDLALNLNGSLNAINVKTERIVPPAKATAKTDAAAAPAQDAPAPEGKVWKLEEVRAVVSAKGKTLSREKILEVLALFGAKTTTEVKPADYAAFVDKINAA